LDELYTKEYKKEKNVAQVDIRKKIKSKPKIAL